MIIKHITEYRVSPRKVVIVAGVFLDRGPAPASNSIRVGPYSFCDNRITGGIAELRILKRYKTDSIGPSIKSVLKADWNKLK